MHRFWKLLALLIACAILLPFTLFALLHTQPGAAVVARLAGSLVSTPNLGLEINGAQLHWGGGATIERVTVADANGRWLSVEGVQAQWHPFALLRGRLAVDHLSVTAISLDRKPAAAIDTQKPDSGGLFALPLDIAIADIRVDEISLGDQLAGAPVRLTADGALHLNAMPAALQASLRMRRDDDIAGQLEAALAYQPEQQTLRFALHANEPDGGVIARLLDIGELPAIELTLNGDGPLDNWQSDLAVSLNGEPTVSGTATLAQSGSAEAARDFRFQLDGRLAQLLPDGIRPLFAGNTAARGDIALGRDFTPLTGTLNAETDSFALKAAGDLSPVALAATLSANLKTPVALRFSNQEFAVDVLSVTASVDGTLESANWNSVIDGQGIAMNQGRLGHLAIKATGQDANLRATARSIPARIDGTANIESLRDPRLASLIGTTHAKADLVLRAGNQIDIKALDVTAPGLQTVLSGAYAPEQATAKGTLSIADLTPFSPLAKRALGGAAKITFDASASPAERSGALAFTATGENISIGVKRLDGLLVGASKLSGTIVRTADGTLSGKDVQLTTPALSLALNGESDLAQVDATITARLSDLAQADPTMSGAIDLDATFTGALDAPQVSATLTGDALTLRDEPVENLQLTSELTASTLKPAGTIELSARFRGQPLAGSATLSSDETGIRRIDDIALATGNSKLTGQFAFAADDTPSGTLDFSSPDLAEIAPLLLQKLAGALTARVDIGQENGVTLARVTAKGGKLARDNIRVAALDLTATISDFLSTPRIDGRLNAEKIQAGSTVIPRLDVEATGTTAGTDFKASTALAGGELALVGKLTQTADGIAVTLSEGNGHYRDLKTRLAAPARALIRKDGVAHIETATLALGSGTATIAGTAGKVLDMTVGLDGVPVALANAVAPGLGLGGTLSGGVAISGASSDPTAKWALQWNSIEASALAGFGLPSASLKSDGHYKGKTLSHTSVLSVGSEGGLTAKGALALADNPRLDMTVTGTLPFALARRALTGAGLRLDGAANLDMRIGGTVRQPAINGTITTRDTTAVSLNTGLVVKAIAATARISSSQIEIANLTGAIGGGGTMSGSGTIGLGGEMPAQIALKITDGAYTDGRILSAKLNADLSLSGPLATTPTLSGSVFVKRADITIPQTLATSLSPVAVTHVNAPGDVARQAATLRKGPTDSSARGVNLDLDVNAPGQIFVRGRGLQAELGGRIRITGTSANPVTSGAFTLRRGTLTVLSRLLTFTKGRISFLGNFDPLLDFAASTEANATAITVTVTGNASDPKVGFTSSPDYPQEEILALLLFNQNLSNLSAAQVAQLASAVAALGGADPLDRLRKSLGVDAINITTDANNNAAVEVRKKVSDKVYLGVQQGSGEGSSRVTVDIDVTKNIRARGETNASGSSKAGIFFEKEY